MTKRIVDISYHNGNPNWSVLAPQLDLAICRVQYGSNKKDVKYNEYVAALESYGILHAAYAYGCYVSVADAIVEAKDFLARVNQNAKFLVLDVEDDTLVSMKDTSKLAEASQAFIDTCKAAGWKVGLYVAHHMYGDYNLQSVQADFIWLPRYGTNDGNPQKKPSYPCDIWQYTDNGYIEGIGRVDINLLEGDKSLNWYIGNHAGLTAPEVGKRVISKVDQLRFYSKPSWSDKDVAGIVTKGLGFEIIEKIDVDGSPQYKVKNSKGNVFYITASPTYVEVK
ncbi:N-acetylmuramoyl-L-alanine amidase [Bacillus cereus]|uniref:GH25 family lysozyme n=1 Tax=Bacillus cereus TaxID=1396 RepID=UPI000C2D134D|nr:GH25 family lysozyme [Bacillus cereus]AUB62482.1 N-acetylmuramoyl-L-alanine amidase [Bacillus cereus]